MEILLGLTIGIGLAAACGFRIFVPLTVMSVAALGGHLDLASGFDWIGTYPALVALGAASIVEIAGYYVPWVDNLLDTAATPAAIVAGTIVTASLVGDMSPLLQWSVAAIAGGGTAATVQSATLVLRGGSSVTTGGFGNPIVASAELVASLATAALAVWWPLAALAALVLMSIGLLWLGRRRSRRMVATKGGRFRRAP